LRLVEVLVAFIFVVFAVHLEQFVEIEMKLVSECCSLFCKSFGG